MTESPPVVWRPHKGSQERFLSCPAFEVLYAGTRGNGKTDALIMDFCQHVGQGFGQHWRGVIFREEFTQLSDVIAKTKKWIWQIWAAAKYNASDHVWIFPEGEQLLLRHFKNADDYWNYHGHELPWIGWEELTNWPNADGFEMMKACSRSSHPGMPRKYRATCNPWGAGHGWVKSRFIDPAPPDVPVIDSLGRARVHIHGDVTENTTLLSADPDYVAQLDGLTDENLKKAWRYGDWDIAAGGIFSDVWSPKAHVLEPFTIPAGWRINRSFDWGSSRPFSVGWWAECDGTQAPECDRHFPKGTLIRIAEWYGWNGKPNEGCRMLDTEIARGILEREKAMGFTRVHGGAADSAIFATENGQCIADAMGRCGVRWTPAAKGPGSRVSGWEQVRTRLKAAMATPMEDKGLLVFSTCRQFLRTVPTLIRDPKKPDDVDTDAEDHCADEVRYRVVTPLWSGGYAPDSLFSLHG